MYEISENKDISIKSVERVVMESAFDCGLNYQRNKVQGEDGSRECEYMECMYTCDGIDMDTINSKKLDYSTYQLYYDQKTIQENIDIILNIFKKQFEISLSFIIGELKDTNTNMFELLTALFVITQHNIATKNKYGFISYIKEEDNNFFLIENLNLPSRLSSVYYTQNPNIIVNHNFDNIIKPFFNNVIPNLIGQLFNSTSILEIQTRVKSIPIDIIEYIIEKSIQAHQANIVKNQISRNLILDHFKDSIVDIDGIIVSSFLKFKLRCLEDGAWKDCDQEIIDKFELLQSTTIENYVEKTREKGYNYYGQLNPDNNTFCIRDISSITTDKKGDARKSTSGQVCRTITPVGKIFDIAFNDLKLTNNNLQQLHQYILQLAKAKVKIIDFDVNNKQHLLQLIKAHAKLKPEYYSKITTVNGLQNFLYYGTRTKDNLCDIIREWFRENDLLQITTDCGDTSKKKPKE